MKDEVSDLAEEYTDLRRSLTLASTSQIGLLRWTAAASVIAVPLAVATLLAVMWITAETNDTVERQVVPLRQVVSEQSARIEERDARIGRLETRLADADALLDQAFDWIDLQAQMLRDAGVDPPEIGPLRP